MLWICDGSAQISITGGTTPYLITWNPPISSSTSISGLAAGTYTCTVTDGNGCSESIDVVIGQPQDLSMTIAPTSATCSQCNGEAAITGAGGYRSLQL